MRSKSRILLILAISVMMAVALPAVPSQTQAICVPYDIELTPKTGAPGTEVSVYGHDFAEDTLVDIYYEGTLLESGRTDDGRGDFTVLFTVPEGAKGPYEVTADVGYVAVSTLFIVNPGLTINPEQGPVGTTVTVVGQGFAANEEYIELQYYTDGNYETVARRITANIKGSWEASFAIPPSTQGKHKLDAEGDDSWPYEVEDAIFRVTSEISIDKWSGIAGDTVTMTGSKFTAYEKGIMIFFDDETVVTDIKADARGEWQESFQVPKMPAGEYSITAEGQRTSREDVGNLSFEIEPEFILSDHQGHVGMDLTVTGRGFPAYEDVIILYDDSQVATAETDDQGAFEETFSVPDSKHGEHQVRATPTEGSNNTADLEITASATFTMESTPPPVPEQTSPVDRSRLGFIGKVMPTFEWSEVSDESGVAYYNLKIATSADFTAPSVVFSDAISTGTSYTLQETDALSLGTYYWIVQAVDDAENESGWSANHSFRVGLLPRWGFIVIIVVAVILFVALIRALLRRRSIYYDGW